MKSDSGKASVLWTLLAGAVVFSAGLVAASRRLPEWRMGSIPPPPFFQERFRQLLKQAGLRPVGAPAQVRLRSTIETDEDLDLCPIYGILGRRAADWLTSAGRGMYVEVAQATDWPGAALLKIHFSRDGRAWAAQWGLLSLAALRHTERWPEPEELGRPLITVLRGDRESIGPAEKAGPIAGVRSRYPILGSRPPQSLTIAYFRGLREITGVERAVGQLEVTSLPSLVNAVVHMFVFLGVPLLFLLLAIQRRMTIKNGAFLSCLLFLVLLPESFRRLPVLPDFLSLLLRALMAAFFFFLLWSAAESWLRSRLPEFTTSLDALRAGRLGPRGGRALLAGCGLGAVLAGARLAVMALATSVPGLAPNQPSVLVPVFAPEGSFFGQGLLPAGLLLLALGLAVRFFSARRVAVVAIPLGALLLLPRVPLCPPPLAYLTALLLAGVLFFAYQGFGLTALLTASAVSYFLPAALFSARHLAWGVGSFAAASGVTLSLLAFGLVGITRSPQAEARRLAPPSFVRRLEQERRVRYEMDLLARMQVGLLPEKPPEVSGYELAARSILATEVGGDLYDFLQDDQDRLWIAAGDVSGHGYSCAIAQAMTKAALASLVKSDRSPSQVLAEADRVLRKGSFPRTFTTLSLLRLEPATGDGLLSNAGHPYALLAAGAEVGEVHLPSLPLGQGPSREYRDERFRIQPGGVLVLFSDGFVEGTNAGEEPYGFDRPRELLRSLVRRPADAILEALLADWRQHVGPEAPTDDTTLVVLKRILESSASVVPLTPAS